VPRGSTRRLVLGRWLRPGWEVDDARYTAAREAEVLRRLAATPVPVPGVVALDEDGALTGAPATLMTHIDGTHPSLADERRPARIAAMAEALVAVHAVDRRAWPTGRRSAARPAAARYPRLPYGRAG
jgi:aminoglycoside phosphotransferase (APT) family kinase protein